jgi:hypothetical protein
VLPSQKRVTDGELSHIVQIGLTERDRIDNQNYTYCTMAQPNNFLDSFSLAPTGDGWTQTIERIASVFLPVFWKPFQYRGRIPDSRRYGCSTKKQSRDGRVMTSADHKPVQKSWRTLEKVLVLDSVFCSCSTGGGGYSNHSPDVLNFRFLLALVAVL